MVSVVRMENIKVPLFCCVFREQAIIDKLLFCLSPYNRPLVIDDDGCQPNRLRASNSWPAAFFIYFTVVFFFSSVSICKRINSATLYGWIINISPIEQIMFDFFLFHFNSIVTAAHCGPFVGIKWSRLSRVIAAAVARVLFSLPSKTGMYSGGGGGGGAP